MAATLGRVGISRGQMQHWQVELSKTAAMAALLAGNAGWWQLQALLSALSAQAAAGAKPCLLPLMQVRADARACGQGGRKCMLHE